MLGPLSDLSAVDPASIARRFPRAVIVSVTAAGDDEEEPIKPAHDLSVRAIAGQLPLDRPMSEAELDGAPVADLLTGAYAAIAALAGLVGRTADRGSILGVSMVDSAFGLNAIALTAALQGLAPEDMMRAPAGYRTFRCGDGALVAIGVSYESHHWATLCQRLGLEHMSSLSVAERVDRRVELNEEFAAVIATMPLDTVIELAGEGLPVEPVRGPADVVAAGLLPVLADRAGTRHLASPIVVDGRRLPVRLAAPGRPVRLAQDG